MPSRNSGFASDHAKPSTDPWYFTFRLVRTIWLRSSQRIRPCAAARRRPSSARSPPAGWAGRTGAGVATRFSLQARGRGAPGKGRSSPQLDSVRASASLASATSSGTVSGLGTGTGRPTVGAGAASRLASVTSTLAVPKTSGSPEAPLDARPVLTGTDLLAGGAVLVVALLAWASLILAHLGAHSLLRAVLLGAGVLVVVCGLALLGGRFRVRRDVGGVVVALVCAGIAAALTFPGFSYG